ncbi:tetratricopeptide repeat protein [Sandaracinus amylolyticus]|uniref:Thiol-disulfide isomerase n=1 Tax=Sandaracinus amylolyticus TaxID=927083 RepID=A0A0F6W7Z3_9BACT|nr:tetratricopeptide repeat protein [Sandaracinus amylolyticus]AKF09627.1 Thiol-disulfide isomerase [Sandaracinus amylolyticus]
MKGLLVLALTLGIVSPALAQTPDPTRDAEARALFDAGAASYEAGRYDEALGYFQRSYELSGRPQLLYNIGSAAERTRQDALALRSYEEYLRLVPDAPNRARAETRIEALRRIVSADETAEPPTAEQAATAAVVEPSTGPSGGEPSSGPGVGPWIVVGGGAAVMVAGAILLGVGLADRAAVEDPADGARWADAEAAYERGPAILTSGIVLLPVGAAIVGAGLAWAFIPVESGGVERISLRVGPGSIAVAGRF